MMTWKTRNQRYNWGLPISHLWRQMHNQDRQIWVHSCEIVMTWINSKQRGFTSSLLMEEQINMHLTMLLIEYFQGEARSLINKWVTIGVSYNRVKRILIWNNKNKRWWGRCQSRVRDSYHHWGRWTTTMKEAVWSHSRISDHHKEGLWEW